MDRKNFLLCYDIADEKRLAKISRRVERKAFRIQKSVYVLYDASKEELFSLIDDVMKIFNEKEDDLRVYTIKKSGIALGDAVDLDNPFTIVDE